MNLVAIYLGLQLICHKISYKIFFRNIEKFVIDFKQTLYKMLPHIGQFTLGVE